MSEPLSTSPKPPEQAPTPSSSSSTSLSSMSQEQTPYTINVAEIEKKGWLPTTVILLQVKSGSRWIKLPVVFSPWNELQVVLAGPFK